MAGIQNSGARPQTFEHQATKNGGNIFYLAFEFAICNYCICIVPVHTNMTRAPVTFTLIGIYIEVVSCAWACSAFFCPYVDRVNQLKDA